MRCNVMCIVRIIRMYLFNESAMDVKGDTNSQADELVISTDSEQIPLQYTQCAAHAVIASKAHSATSVLLGSDQVTLPDTVFFTAVAGCSSKADTVIAAILDDPCNLTCVAPPPCTREGANLFTPSRGCSSPFLVHMQKPAHQPPRPRSFCLALPDLRLARARSLRDIYSNA